MKKRSLKRLVLKKTSISNLEKTATLGGINSLDSQVSCYLCPMPLPIPLPTPIPPMQTIPLPKSVVYWLCPR